MHRFRGVLLLLLCSACSTAGAATADDLMRAGLAAEARFDSRGAVENFLQADRAKPDDAFILQKIARQYSDMIIDVPKGQRDEKKRLAQLALDYSLRAQKLAPDDPVNVLSVAISYGEVALHSDNRTKVRYSRQVKEGAERAIALKPDYDFAHHVLGRWHYEVAELGGVVRFFANALYDGLPPGTFREAAQHLERAAALAPQTPLHQVELGFAYLALGEKEKARAAWKRSLDLPSHEKHDDPGKARARAALAKLK